MKKFIIGLFLGLYFLVNTMSYGYSIRYRITAIVRGRTIYTDTITESEYNRKWKHMVPYSFSSDIEKETCRIPAIVEIKRMIR